MLTELQIRKFTKLFTMYDDDNNGVIGLEDFERVVKKLIESRGLTANSPHGIALYGKFAYYWMYIKGKRDANRDHKVTLQEWFNYYQGILLDDQRYEIEIASLVDIIFDIFDPDEDGNMSKTEWITFMGIYHNHRFYAETTFTKIDINQDGLISKEEFLQVFHDFHYNDDPQSLGNMLFMPY